MTQQPKTDWLDALKRGQRHFSVGGTPAFNNQVKGWNDCIDHLAQRGMLVPNGWVAVPKIEENEKLKEATCEKYISLQKMEKVK